jgi:hypothetical protein
MSKKVTAELRCLSTSDGELLYKYPLFDGVVTCIPSSFLVDAGGNVVAGGMFFEGEKWDSKNSDGIFFLKLSPEGEKLIYTKQFWDGKLQDALAATETPSFKLSSKPKVLFEEIVETGNGGYMIVSETFTKNYQMISIKIKDGISGRYIGDIHDNDANNKPMTLEIMDFLIFNYNSEGELVNLNCIPKEHTKVSAYKPYNGYGGLALAQVVAENGFFNYGFCTYMPGSDEPIMVSANYSSKDPFIGFHTIAPGQKTKTTKKQDQ